MWSCFKEFVIRNLMVQSKFNLYLRFKSYDFFKFAKTILHACVSGAWVDGIAYHAIVKKGSCGFTIDVVDGSSS